MKLDEAMARTMSPTERAILEEWAARDGPLAEACWAALHDLDALRAAQTDVLDTTEIGQQAREIRRFSEKFEAEIAKSDRSARMLVRAAELAHLYMDGKITIIEYTDEVARLGKDVTAAGPADG